MSQFRRLSISNRGLIIGDEPDLNKGEEHPWVVVGGVPYPTRRVGVNLRASALNYGKGRLSGYGAWRTICEAHTAFRLRDHMHRVRRNGLNMILKGDMPSEQWLMQQALLGLGLGIPHLSVADDVYGRTLVLSGAAGQRTFDAVLAHGARPGVLCQDGEPSGVAHAGGAAGGVPGRVTGGAN